MGVVGGVAVETGGLRGRGGRPGAGPVGRARLLGGVALFLGAAGILVPAGAFGQEAGEKTEDGTMVLQPVSVTASPPGDVEPGGKVVDAETMERSNPSDLKDIFTTEPGVTVGGAIPISQKLYVHGLEDQQLNVKIDGARQVNSTFHHMGTLVIDPELLKEVRIEPGVAPADAGPGALGGAVEFETKDARDMLAPGDDRGGFVSLEYNTNTEGFTEKGAVAARGETFEALGYFSNAGGNSYKDGDGDQVAGTAPEAIDGLVKLAANGNGGSRLEFSVDRLRDEGVRPNRPNFAGVTFSSEMRDVLYDRTTITTSYVDEQPSNWINPDISVNYNEVKVKLVPGWWSQIRSFSGEVSNTFTFDPGTVKAGLDFYDDGSSGGAIGSKYSEKATNVGFFAQARLSPIENGRVSFGFRGDRQWFEGIEGSDFDNFGLSGNINAEYDLASWITPYVGYSNVFGGIPLGESAIYNFSGTWTYEGLEPSRSKSFKAGAEMAYGPFEIDSSINFTRIDDAHNIYSVNRATTADLDSRGIDVSVRYTYDTGFVRAAFSDTRLRENNAVPSTTSFYHGFALGSLYTLEAQHRWEEAGLKIGMSHEYAPKNGEVKTSSGYTPLKTYYVANLYGEWVPNQWRDLTLRLDARNIFDRKYVDRANAGADNSRVFPFAEPGRTFLLTAKLDF